MLRIDDQIGPYTLVSKLGRGSFGVVWLAERRTSITTTKVALKIPLDDEIDLETIRQEANVWVHASGHPNVLPIIEANIYDDHVIIASEFAPDGSLEAWLKKHDDKAPSIESSVEIILGILAGLEHLHSRNIIHRDLKPANIIFQGETPRLADFGVSRVLKSTDHSSTRAGTPIYMAPETFDGERSRQTDIWSVGVLLYQLLTGRLPFPQEDMTALVAAIIMRDPDPLPTTIPESIRIVIERSIQKDKSKRYESASEMRSDLRSAFENARRKVYESDEAPTIPAYPKLELPIAETVKFSETPSMVRSRVIYSIAGAGVLLAALTGGVIISMMQKSPDVLEAPTAVIADATKDEDKTSPDNSPLELFPSEWHGTWNSPSGNTYSADVSLEQDQRNAANINGSIIWTLNKSQSESMKAKIGLSGTELIRGHYNPQTRLLTMEGYEVVGPNKIISTDGYRLNFSEDGKSLSGVTSNHEKWNSVLSLTRGFTPDLGPGALADNLCPERSGYLVIGRGSPNVYETMRELKLRKTQGFDATCIVDSSKWSNLNSSWFITTFGIYADQKAANNMKKQLETRGIDGLYVKHSGDRQN